MRAYHGVT